MAHLTRASGTRLAMARASARLALRLPLLAGTGTSQHGPSMSAAIRGAAIRMAAAVGIFKSQAVAMARKLFGNEYPGIAKMLNNLAMMQTNQRKFGEAKATLREVVAFQRK